VRVVRFYLRCAFVTCFAIMKLLQVVSVTGERCLCRSTYSWINPMVIGGEGIVIASAVKGVTKFVRARIVRPRNRLDEVFLVTSSIL
jgi:hypothetical protein